MNILDLVPWYVWAAVGAALCVWIYMTFGRNAGIAAILVTVGAVLAKMIRKDAQDNAATDKLKEEVRNADNQADQVRRADAAADRARLDAGASPDGLRTHDPFERR